jgi:hypothetical protein
MRRRDFLGIFGCALTWPVASNAQSTERGRVVGILNILGPDDPEGQARTTFSSKLFSSYGGWSAVI